MNLFDVSEGIRKCASCSLVKNRLLPVAGFGNENASIVFVGETPDILEDREGLPFIGKSGKYLDSLFEMIGIKRENIFLTEAVKCHPKGNRKPKINEIKTCKKLWLDKQIKIIKPKLIVLMGRIAVKSMLNMNKIEHGKFIEKDGFNFFITFNPAEAMKFPKIDKLMREDFLKLSNKI